ncbi:MAG: DNA mismatch repair protein MutS [Bryobacterales bacterium]|nr:DNA mismatch repair protein MutS [Bryobacterales bacterium]
MEDPKTEYGWRLDRRRQTVSLLDNRHLQIGNLRLLTAIAFVLMAWLTYPWREGSAWLLGLPAVIFISLAVWHDRLLEKRARARRAAAVYERALARLAGDWAGKGETGERFLDPDHPYAQDLDLFGPGSLFELLSTARTRSGEEMLARWLQQPAQPEELAARHQAIAELRERLDLREDFAVLGEDVRSGVHPDRLLAWAEGAPVLASRSLRAIGAALSFLMASAAALWWWQDLLTPLAASLAAVTAFGWRLRPAVLHVAARAGDAAHDLGLLSEVLTRLEQERFTSPRLAGLRQALETGGLPPSRRIQALRRRVEWLDSRDNVILRVIGPPLLYTTHVAFTLEAWRVKNGPLVRQWLDAVGEFEALSSLAAYAYERPDDAFPEFVPGGEAVFEAGGLGHPLLPGDRMVRNDLTLGRGAHLLLVSGSNMSGKSTLLRSAGTAAVMAMAGAPVRAHRLRLSALAIGASIRVSDSLQSGISRFYAEILRLKRIADLASGSPPLLFLLDELLHGTNSHDRQIGADALLRRLVDGGAIGLATTHDLALTQIVESLGARAANVHFADHFEEGEMRFDYRMQPGVVAKSNALALMRSIGLEV